MRFMFEDDCGRKGLADMEELLQQIDRLLEENKGAQALSLIHI